MTAIFISHRSSDAAFAGSLKEWLGRQGHTQLFLDFDPADGIAAGMDWEQTLYRALRRCQAVIIVLTPAWLASKWCHSEMTIAREKGKAVFVVRAAPCPDDRVIPALQEVDLSTGDAAEYQRLARGLKEQGLDPASAFDWTPGRPIYPGLAAFDMEDAAVYFGRAEESWQVVEALRRMAVQPAGAPKLLLVTGASGSGKSSLMRAGVLARLRKDPARWIVARAFRRGGDARAALAASIAAAFPAHAPRGPVPEGDLLALVRDLRGALDRPGATLVLAIDQAEELLAPGSDAAPLLDLLRTALAGCGDELLVLATIRSDRLGEWQRHPSIRAGPDHGELRFEMAPLGPMPMSRIGEIVRGPARLEELAVDDELVQAVRAETNTPDALPLLAYTLRFMRDRLGFGRGLTLGDYRAFGGLEGSVRSQADAAIAIGTLADDDRTALRDAFLPGLVNAAADGSFTRNQARMDTLPPRARPLLLRLVDARLLQTDRDSRGNETIEVTHEALLRVWPTLEAWIAEDAVSLRRLDALKRAAAEWSQNAEGADFLVHRELRLSDIEALLREPRFAARLEDRDRHYLDGCRAAQDRRDAEERASRERDLTTARELSARRRAWLRLASAAAIGSLALAGAAGWQWERARTAQDQAEAATSRSEQDRTDLARQLQLANAALAASIWSDLDFGAPDTLEDGELKALWKMAVASAPVRAIVLAQLRGDPDRMHRFARRPDAVARAIGLAWPDEAEAMASLKPVTDAAAADETDPFVAALGAVLLPRVPARQAGAVLLDLLKPDGPGSSMARPGWLRPLVLGLARRVLPADTGPVLAHVLAALPGGDATRHVPLLALTMEGVSGALSPDQAGPAQRAVLDAMRPGTPPATLRDLAAAVRALDPKSSGAGVAARWGPIVAALDENLYPADLEALAAAIRASPAPIDAATMEGVLTRTLATLERAGVPTRRGPEADKANLTSIVTTLSTLAAALDPRQRRAAFDAVAGFAVTERDDTAALLGPALQELATSMAAGDVAGAFRGRVLEGLGQPQRPGARAVLTEAARTLAPRLPPDAAAEILASLLPLVASQEQTAGADAVAEVTQVVASRLTESQARTALPLTLELMRTPSSEVRAALALIVARLQVPLSPDQARAALPRPDDPLWHAAPGLRALAGRLPPEIVRASLVQTVADYTHDRTEEDRTLRAGALAALVEQMPEEEARAALAPLFSDLAAPRLLIEVRPLVVALPPALTADAARIMLRRVVAELPADTRDYHALHVAFHLLGPLAPRAEAAAAPAVLGAIATAAAAAPEVVPEDVPLAAEMVKALAGRVAVDVRQGAATALIAAMGQGPNTRKLALLSRTLQALDVPLTDVQEQAAQAPVLKILISEEKANAVLAATALLVGRVPASSVAEPLRLARERLALAPSLEESQGWARVLAALLRQQDGASRLPVLVEALKSPSAAGPATGVLLDAIHDADPRAPGAGAGLDATLGWLRASHPAIDLDRPAVCPQSLTGTVCAAP